jgi:LysR family transcriptional activator of nhaA
LFAFIATIVQLKKIRISRIDGKEKTNVDRLNFNHLFNFYAVAKSGSVKNAAIDLGLSSSTLSEQMKGLERSVGEPLFIRVGRNLTLNTRGQRLYRKIEGFFSGATELLDKIDLDGEGVVRRVEIGITTTISRVFAFEILKPLFREDGAHVRVTESQADTLLMDFKHQSIDILITHEKLSASLVKRLKTLVIREPELVVVAGKEYAKRLPRFPEGLSGTPFFLFTVRTPLRWEIEKFFKTHTILPDVRGEVDDPEILKAAAMDNLGVTILPDHAITEDDKKKLTQLGVLPRSEVRIYAYYLGGDASPEVERVLGKLKCGREA